MMSMKIAYSMIRTGNGNVELNAHIPLKWWRGTKTRFLGIYDTQSHAVIRMKTEIRHKRSGEPSKSPSLIAVYDNRGVLI